MKEQISKSVISSFIPKKIDFSFQDIAEEDFSVINDNRKIPVPFALAEMHKLRGYIDLNALFISYHDEGIYNELLKNNSEQAALIEGFEELRIYLIAVQKYKGVRKNCLFLFSKKYQELKEDILLDFASRSCVNFVKRVKSSLFKKELDALYLSMYNSALFYQLLGELLGAIKSDTKEQKEDKHQTELTLPTIGEKNKAVIAKRNTRKYTEELAERHEQQSGGVVLFNATSIDSNFASQEHKTLPYRIYSKDYDEVISARNILRRDELQALWQKFHEEILAKKKLSNSTLKNFEKRLIKHFARFNYNKCDGCIDTKKLANLIASPNKEDIFKQKKELKENDSCITFLLDNSGSMQGEPIMATITATYFLAHFLEKMGVKTEVLGYTTKNWQGGEAYKSWLKNKIPNPGRVSDVRHIYYKKRGASLRQSSKYFALMLKQGFLKENIDGEALEWCYRRIKRFPEKNKVITVISDGAPIDEASMKLNKGELLEEHLRNVIEKVSGDKEVNLIGCGINYNIAKFYKNTITLASHKEFNDKFMDSFLKLIK